MASLNPLIGKNQDMTIPKEINDRVKEIAAELHSFTDKMDGPDREALLHCMAHLLLIGLDDNTGGGVV